MKAVIMAGGFGTRIQPLTSSVPKPMIPVLNMPMMERIVTMLRDAGITDIVVLLYFKPDVVKDHFGDGSAYGVRISYVLPDDDYGTAGAVKKAAEHLDERFIIVSGDLITDFNIPEIIGYHEAKQSKATITLTSVPDPLQFGVVITDKQGRILRFLEKPGWGEVFSDTINTGIYVFEPEILDFIPDGRSYDFSKDLFPGLMAGGITLYGCSAKGYWRDVGNPDSYRAALIDIIDGQVKLPMPGTKITVNGATVYTGKNVKLAESASFDGIVVLGDNVTVEEGAAVTGSVIGDGCTVGRNARIEKSILWNDVRVGEKSALSQSVLCNGVIIGKNVKGEHGCIIAENTEVGNYVVFEKDVMVWPNKQIEEGSIVSSNLIWGDKWKKSIFEGGMVSARTNVELSADMSAKLGAAFGSILPRGGRVLLSRDYHRASRMLKRCFLGGLLSTGVNAVDVRMAPLPVMRYKLTTFGQVAGVHFRQSPSDPTHTEILFYDETGAVIDSGQEKNIERIFFRENFRRATHDEIGEIYDQPMLREFYKEAFIRNVDIPLIKGRNFKVAVDLQNGTTDSVFPDILNKLSVDAVIVNAHHDEEKLSRTIHQIEQTTQDVAGIVKVLDADIGFTIYPHGERVRVIGNDGRVIDHDRLLLTFIKLLDMAADAPTRVYVPAYAPTALDHALAHVEIHRGRFVGLKTEFLRNFAFAGDTSNNFIFPVHSTNPDAMFASVSLMELLVRADRSLTEVLEEIPEYHYFHSVINCPLELKGYLMRRMSEEAMDKDASFLDGIKITFKNRGWVHMVPDQYSPNVHLYVEAPGEAAWKELHDTYTSMINTWLEEHD